MTTLPTLSDHDRRRVTVVGDRLAELNAVGVFRAADVHVARALAGKAEESNPDVVLALALAVRAIRSGSVCVDLREIATTPVEVERVGAGDEARLVDPAEIGWPAPDSWLEAVAASPLVEQRVLRLEGPRVYLDRYWREEQQVADDLRARLARRAPEVDLHVLEQAVARVFPADGYDEQRAAVRAAARQWTTVLTGGPGTGKTTAAAGLLALLIEQDEIVRGRAPRIALAAPTARAAARLQESIAVAAAQLAPADRARLTAPSAMTLHRLLGWRPDSSVRFRHNRSRRLPFDIVVVDEASMVSLTMMARLLEALRPDTRLVLMGDPGQLFSVEAGAVLADLVDGFAGAIDTPVVTLRTVHRFDGGIRRLADALRNADADAVVAVLTEGLDDVELVDPTDAHALARVRADVVDVALSVRAPAEAGDAEGAVAALGQHRLLCAHRDGPYGVGGWNREIERMLDEHVGSYHGEWYPGRPVMITANDRSLGVYNGDLGVAVRESDGRVRVHLAYGATTKAFAPSRLPDIQTVHAMTVHKAQGSQAEVVTVVLPPDDSPLLSRELFYTAVTRAQRKVRVVGTEAAVRAAVQREVHRASGLASRLRD